ncbi:hypothetical protein CEXT_93671 [Caerostris extrusa]|uniref:Uncharacterized protein n=1 Tax=Caerostris extrusa TaxID=172846 RepID=A0AAV4SFW5_CAEEX|nr:hypothetical protein CEXT_93671 [Caerostris extrusa]
MSRATRCRRTLSSELPLLRGRVPEDLLQPVLPVRASTAGPLRHRLLLRQGAQSHLRDTRLQRVRPVFPSQYHFSSSLCFAYPYPID